MTVYVDAVLLLNTLINATLLHATARLRASPAKPFRLWLAASFGGFYALACYLPGLSLLQSWWGKLVMTAIMLILAFGVHRKTLLTALVFILLSLALCGMVFFVVTVLFGTPLPQGGIYPVTFSELLLTAGFAYCISRFAFSCAVVRPEETILKLRLTLHGKSLPLTALLDTGNSLCDPISGQAVILVWGHALASLIGKEAAAAIAAEDFDKAMRLLRADQPRLIPFRSVGVHSGLLLAIRCQSLELRHRIHLRPYIALSPTKLSDRGEYSALVGGNFYVQQSNSKAASISGKARPSEAHVHWRKRRASAPTQDRGGAADAYADVCR